MLVRRFDLLRRSLRIFQPDVSQMVRDPMESSCDALPGLLAGFGIVRENRIAGTNVFDPLGPRSDFLDG